MKSMPGPQGDASGMKRPAEAEEVPEVTGMTEGHKDPAAEVRVILSARNGVRYLREQIDSIMEQQSAAGAKPAGRTAFCVRLLISDDVSDDGTADLCRAAARAFPDRILYVRRKAPSGGAARHFLSALKAFGAASSGTSPEDSSGAALKDLFSTCGYGRKEISLPGWARTPAAYWMFSDQDDVWHPDKVRKTLAVMQAAERKYGSAMPLLVHCDMRVTRGTGMEIAPSYVRYQKMSPERHHFRQLLVQNNVTGGAMMINRALLEKILEKPVPEHMVMHDHWIALLAAAFGKVIFLDRALYDYRQHGDNVLGAAKGSVIGEVFARLGLFRKDGKSKKDMDAHSKNVYAALFAQAEELFRLYGEELPERERKELEAFRKLPGKSRPAKIVSILVHGFTFNRLHRTAGECLFL